MMKLITALFGCLLFVASPAFGAPPVRQPLPAPTDVSCPVVGDVIAADWADVEGATKYSVDVIAGFDVAGNGVVDTTLDFDFGTSDRTDGLPISESDLTIPLTALTSTFTRADGTVVTLDPLTINLRVKALNPGRGRGPQNHPFSAVCVVR